MRAAVTGSYLALLRTRNNAHADISFTRMSTTCPSLSIIALQPAVRRMFKRRLIRKTVHAWPPFLPISWARMDVACLDILRQLLCPTLRTSTVCGNDGSFLTNPSLRPLPFQCRLSITVSLPPPVRSTLCRRYDLSSYYSSARSIHLVPFTFSSCQGFHIYFLFLLPPSYNFPSFTSDNFARLTTHNPFI
ncbi:hypothetical protein EV421DRAFT_1847699 [Armillaria borealis]|uniref:Uncharacterized protein n=1 Tax=Armillaria borealis TaxID=47425 RepID=A0AA39IZH3_9AGAR|nr:hypothetical protein EV421DRAFT_1847699 [Armillaria borealis]